MLELLEKTRDYLRGKEQKKVASFTELVKAVCDGGKKAPTPAQIDETLEASGKTLDDLDQAVSYRQQRMELARQRATAPQLQRELDEVNDKFQAEAAKWEAAARDHNNMATPLAYRARELEQIIAEAKGCETKLVDGYRGPLRDELAEIAEARRQIHLRMEDIGNSREHHANWARPSSDFAKGSVYHNPTEHETAAHRKIAEGLDGQLAELRGQLAKLQEREDAIQIEMSKP